MGPRASVIRNHLGHWLLLVSSYHNTKRNLISLVSLAANCLTPIGLDESIIAYRSQIDFMEAVNILKCSTTVVGSS